MTRTKVEAYGHSFVSHSHGTDILLTAAVEEMWLPAAHPTNIIIPLKLFSYENYNALWLFSFSSLALLYAPIALSLTTKPTLKHLSLSGSYSR